MNFWNKKCIIHKEISREGKELIAITYPTKEWEGTMEELGRKDIPKDHKFKVVDPDDIPADYTFHEAWEIEDNLLTDGVGEKEE